jgi:hypothetical protein
MPELFAYTTSILNFSGNTVTLPTSYDLVDDRVILDIDDDDAIFEGDLNNNDDGNDANQFGTVTDTSGNIIAGGSSTTIYAENQFNLVAPDGTTITLYAVEVDSDPGSSSGNGILVGYLPSQPLEPGVVYTFTRSNTTPSNDQEYNDIAGAICFTTGTKIATLNGLVNVEDLVVGDMVVTADNGLQPIKWIGKKHISGARMQAFANLRPIKLCKDALGPGLPQDDMWLSPHHRVLISGHAPTLAFGVDQVLAPAKGICNDHSIFVDYSVKTTQYYHILFESHEVIYSNGLPSESFHPGAVGLETIEDEYRAELFQVFPDLRTAPMGFGPSARPSLKIREAAAIAAQAKSTLASWNA